METMIEACCKKLKIGRTIYKGYKEIEASSHEEFLLKLLQTEVLNRQQVRKNRLLKGAGFDVIKTFQNYNFDHVLVPKSIDMENVKNMDFIQKKENLILYGSVGTGNYQKYLVIERNERIFYCLNNNALISFDNTSE